MYRKLVMLMYQPCIKNLDLQIDALKAYGCDEIFEEVQLRSFSNKTKL